MKTNIYFWSYLAHFFLEWEMFQTKFVEEIKTHILCSITFFFQKSCRFWDNVEKYCRAGQATEDNMAHAYCILDTQGYKHTFRICNICYFSTVTMVTRKLLVVMLYVCVHCSSCSSSLYLSLQWYFYFAFNASIRMEGRKLMKNWGKYYV